MTPITRLMLCMFFGCASLLAADNPVKVDNDFVRIVKGVDMPHKKSAPHRHDFNRVMVYLDAGDMTIISADGHKEEQHWKAGDVAWSPARGLHTSENVGSASIRMIEIELKKPGPPVSPARNPKLDPLVIDPAHYKLLFENNQVRVIRTWREPGGTEPMHEHAGAGRVTVFLTDLDASGKSADGAASKLHASAGDATWTAGSVTHTSTNTGANRTQVIVVEVK